MSITPLLALVSSLGLVHLLIYLLVLAIVIYVVVLVLGMLPLPPGVRQIAALIVGLVGLLYVLSALGLW